MKKILVFFFKKKTILINTKSNFLYEKLGLNLFFKRNLEYVLSLQND